MEENHMGWKLMRGVRRDLINLFRLYAKTNSVRYEDFCKIWKDLKFSLIFQYRVTLVEVLEFSEEILQIAKEYLLSVYEFPTRVAALYTLYGLYFKQPIRDAAKIRFTKSQWEEFSSLILKCKEEKHYDVVFIHLKLYMHGAYNFTATPRPAGLELGFRKYSKKKNINPGSCDVELLYRPVVSEKLVSSLVKLESLYCQKKTELLGKRNIEFIDGNFAKSLQEELKNYASKWQKLSKNSQLEDSFTSLPQLPEPEDNNEAQTSKTSEETAKSKYRSKTINSITVDEVGDDKGDEKEQREKSRSQEVQKQREKFGVNYLKIIAKKKAALYIKQLHEKNRSEKDDGGSPSSSLDLPDLDFD